jgi:Fis family transcriptional regulator
MPLFGALPPFARLHTEKCNPLKRACLLKPASTSASFPQSRSQLRKKSHGRIAGASVKQLDSENHLSHVGWSIRVGARSNLVKDRLESLTREMYRSGIKYPEAVREFQRTFILTVLQDQMANQSRAAARLDIHRNTLRRTLHDLGLDIRVIRATARRKPPQAERPVALNKRAK